MANYKEIITEQSTGMKYTRASRVVIDNPYKRKPAILFTEEEVTTLGELYTITPIPRPLRGDYFPDAEFPILDPETGLETGVTFLQKDVYNALYSLYVYLATSRDIAYEAANHPV
jgi:hypothetical protein